MRYRGLLFGEALFCALASAGVSAWGHSALIVHADYAAVAEQVFWPALFVLTVPTYLPNLLLNYALKSVPATVSSSRYLQPVLAIALSVAMGLDKLHLDIM